MVGSSESGVRTTSGGKELELFAILEMPDAKCGEHQADHERLIEGLKMGKITSLSDHAVTVTVGERSDLFLLEDAKLCQSGKLVHDLCFLVPSGL